MVLIIFLWPRNKIWTGDFVCFWLISTPQPSFKLAFMCQHGNISFLAETKRKWFFYDQRTRNIWIYSGGLQGKHVSCSHLPRLNHLWWHILYLEIFVLYIFTFLQISYLPGLMTYLPIPVCCPKSIQYQSSKKHDTTNEIICLFVY